MTTELWKQRMLEVIHQVDPTLDGAAIDGAGIVLNDHDTVNVLHRLIMEGFAAYASKDSKGCYVPFSRTGDARKFGLAIDFNEDDTHTIHFYDKA
jgi:hypothetical protein